MVLHVSFDDFSEAAKRVLGSNDAYLTAGAKGTMVTAAHAKEERLVVASSSLSMDEAKKRLKAAGMSVHAGAWALDGDPPHEQARLEEVHVAAVSYLSATKQPGVWVDAYDAKPSTVQVLKALYEEFRENGEMPEASFEEFVRIANPNVAIVTPAELEGYIEAKRPDC